MCEIDGSTNDFPKDYNGHINDTDVYIACQYGNKIMTYGHIDGKRDVWLIGYVPSIGRGHNIIKALKEQNIEYIDYRETDEEVEFKFKPKDIEIIAKLMKAKTNGSNISPFSTKNLPSSDVEIPTEKIARYKEITGIIPKNDLLFIHRVTNQFLEDILQKRLRRSRKKGSSTFNYENDMKKLKMSRQVKQYIFVKGFWEEYLDYLEKEITKIYK